MKIVDDKFKNNKKQYILQCLMASVTLYLVLIYVNFVFETTIVVSLGATTFILFTMPHTKRSRPRYILGGYAMGILSGFICSFFIGLNTFITPSILGALAVGLGIFLMVVFNFEHPPAAALSLGIVIEGFDIKTVAFVYLVSVLLLLITHLTKKWFIDLL